jgi:hypothetical protein
LLLRWSIRRATASLPPRQVRKRHRITVIRATVLSSGCPVTPRLSSGWHGSTGVRDHTPCPDPGRGGSGQLGERTGFGVSQ